MNDIMPDRMAASPPIESRVRVGSLL